MTDWILDRKIPLAVILALLVYGVAAVWSASGLYARTDAAEKDICEMKTMIKAAEQREHAGNERLARIETKLDWLVQEWRRSTAGR